MIQAEPITAKEFFESMVEVLADDTCRTCEFWKANKYSNGILSKRWGHCGNLNASERTDTGGECMPEYAFDYGCRFHRAKEAQNAR